jgi:hypothetical protein
MKWKFENQVATLECRSLSGRADVTRPQLGVHQLRFGALPIAGRICGVEREPTTESTTWPARLAESYVRGGDLVATYRAEEGWPFAPQLYWRADEQCSDDKVLCTLSLQVSVSTPLLDTHPQIFAVTELASEKLMQVTPLDGDANVTAIKFEESPVVRQDDGVCCLLWRLPGGKLSYAEIVLASDFRELKVHPKEGGMCQARWELIAEFLEKGVIRRTRLQAVFLPREGDVALAAECCRDFMARPLPLTT